MIVSLKIKTKEYSIFFIRVVINKTCERGEIWSKFANFRGKYFCSPWDGPFQNCGESDKPILSYGDFERNLGFKDPFFHAKNDNVENP